MGTSIEWVRGEDGSEGATWNFARGCSRVDTACENCYAQSLAHRFSGKNQPYEGLTVLGKHGPRWTGEVRFLPEALSIPLKWRKGRRVFPCSMSDAFHNDLTNEQIAAAFGVMAATPQHTYVMTTKRAKRMREWFQWISAAASEVPGLVGERCPDGKHVESAAIAMFAGEKVLGTRGFMTALNAKWPLPNVHLGVSAGTQASADERIAGLLETSPMRPAAVRWVSLEPLLERVSIYNWLFESQRPKLDWVVVGGESGPGARPCDIAWIRYVVEQCKAAQVPCFVKQLGAKPFVVDVDEAAAVEVCPTLQLRDRKGSDMQEWPESLRVREMPAAKGAV